jgi:hypothetical protein
VHIGRSEAMIGKSGRRGEATGFVNLDDGFGGTEIA